MMSNSNNSYATTTDKLIVSLIKVVEQVISMSFHGS